MTVTVQRILGYRDIYGPPKFMYRNILARRIGRKRILQTAALLLTYCRKETQVSVPELVEMFFLYDGKFDLDGFSLAMINIEKFAVNHPQFEVGILSEEALLNLYTWVSIVDDKKIKEDGNSQEDLNSPFLLKLVLLFNDDVLSRFQKAVNTSNRYPDRTLLRLMLTQRFPQNDLVEIDYGQLMYAQSYKVMQLLNFLEASPNYEAIYAKLLSDFGLNTKEEFFKAIGGAVLTPLNVHKSGINTLVINDDADAPANKLVLDKLAHATNDVIPGPTDYKFLREKPLQKVDGEYRVVFDLFLLKKMYNGIVFKLQEYANKDKNIFKGSVFGSLRDRFTEATLLYETLGRVFNGIKTVTITGNEFKAAKLEREPDFYCRSGNKILLAESKDIFIPAADKLSYDFATIMAALSKDGKLKKSTEQLSKNVERILEQSLPIDKGHNPTMDIYPVVVLHDSLYDCPGLNYWTNEWFQEELSKLKDDPRFKKTDFSPVRPVTLIDIDLLILYRENFEKGQLNLYDLIDQFQNYVDYKSATDAQFDRVSATFSNFVKEIIDKQKIKPNLKLLEDVYHVSGFTD